MKGSKKVVELLNTVLTNELVAINQYFLHARMCENWGYERLWHKVRAESIDEMKHADKMIERHPLPRRPARTCTTGGSRSARRSTRS
jgi:bacterioferritin